jgi:hypothetical protein
MLRLEALCLTLALAAGVASAQERRPMSPRGSAAAQVGGAWTPETQTEDARYTGGKWIEVDYGRPIKRGREALFGSGPDYGKKLIEPAPVWRAGANKTTRLTTEVPLLIGGKRVEPGTYSIFVDLKEGAWTFIVSKQPAAEKYDPKDKSGATWGAERYDAKFDVARAPMKNTKLAHSVDQFTIGFVDMTDKGGAIAMAWDKDAAFVDFAVAP